MCQRPSCAHGNKRRLTYLKPKLLSSPIRSIRKIWSVASMAWLSVILWLVPLLAPIDSATITYVQAQPSTVRRVSAISGAAPGINTRVTSLA